MYKRLIIVMLMMFLLAGQVFAQGGERKGTAGAQELAIPIGSRATSLGGSVIADVYGLESIYWNPAGASSIKSVEAMFSYLDYIADMKFTFGAVGANVPGFGTISVSARILSIGDIIVTTEDIPMGTGDILSPNFTTLGITYSRQMTDRIYFGTSINLINERISQMNAQGWCMDFGFQYVPGLIRGLKIGVVIKNIGPNLTFSGRDLEHFVPVPGSPPGSQQHLFSNLMDDFELPSYFQIGISLNPIDEEKTKLTVLTSYRNNNFIEDEYCGGLEYSYNDMLFLRGGYTGSAQEEYSGGPAFGAGVKLKMGVNAFCFDYSWAQTSRYFQSNQWFSLRFSF